MAILDFFMESPGDKKRRERAHKDNLGLIDAREAANTKAVKELNDRARLDANFDANAAAFKFQEQLAKTLMLEQGLDSGEAMLQARQQMNKMAVAPGQEKMTSAIRKTEENYGAIPQARQAAEIRTAADIDADFARQREARLAGDIARARETSAVNRARAEDQSATDRANMESAISGARLKTAGPAAAATDLATSAIATTAGDRAVRERGFLPDEDLLKEYELNHKLTLEQNRDMASELAFDAEKRKAGLIQSRLQGKFPALGVPVDVVGNPQGMGPNMTARALGLDTSAVPVAPRSGRRVSGRRPLPPQGY